MKKPFIESLLSEDDLKNACKASEDTDYLEITHVCCKSFENDLRKRGMRSFNVWVYLADQFFKFYTKYYENKKPPKASTIQQWFDADTVGGAKLGTDDLKLICQFINDPTPLIAYHEQSMKLFSVEKHILHDIRSLNDKIAQLCKVHGELTKEYINDAVDGELDEQEVITLSNLLTSMIGTVASISKDLNKKKTVKFRSGRRVK